MLVLTRRVGEMVSIGEDIIIKVVEVRGGQVRLGIAAPEELNISRVDREESDKS
ncbi:MAG TPA: carbon storage regulator [Geobacterales bacterium]|jgi:carbon storage regulator|nr:carbon storage regulator [Geobacterales bacterium]